MDEAKKVAAERWLRKAANDLRTGETMKQEDSGARITPEGKSFRELPTSAASTSRAGISSPRSSPEVERYPEYVIIE